MRAAPLVETVWKRQTEFERTLVNVIAPLCRVHIECFSHGRRSDYPEFSALEWDEIVKAVADKRRELLAVLQLDDGDITMAIIALDEKAKKLEAKKPRPER